MRIAVSREPGAERVVRPPELFLDLVDVFAIGQLSLMAGPAAACAVLLAVAVADAVAQSGTAMPETPPST